MPVTAFGRRARRVTKESRGRRLASDEEYQQPAPARVHPRGWSLSDRPASISLGGHAAPPTDDERLLRQIWGDVLGLVEVGLEDDFFDLGGDSLAAVRVVSEARTRLVRDFSLADLFERPTIAAFAAAATRPLNDLRFDAAYPRTTTTDVEVLPSLRQEHLLELIRAAPQMGTHRPVPVLYACKGDVSSAEIEAGLTAAAVRHDVLRSSFQAHGDAWSVRIRAADAVSVEVREVDASDWSGQRLAGEIARESSAAFRAGSDCLLRAVHYRGNSSGDRVLLVADHLVMDGESFTLLASEMGASSGAERPRLQYYDYAAAQRAAHADGRLDDALEYWSNQLERYGPWPKATLPTLRQRTSDQPTTADLVRLPLSADVVGAFASRCQNLGVSPYDGYLASACDALAQLGGDQGEGFGVIIISASRSWPSTSSLIGWFADYVTVGIGRVPPRFAETAQSVHAAVSTALRHDVVPRAEILSRSSRDGASFPRVPCVLFNKPLDAARRRIDLGSGSLVHEALTLGPRTRRYPGLMLIVGLDRETGGAFLECEYGVGECDRDVIENLVETWRRTIWSEIA
jgi:aryl carrier-like protein